MKKAPTTKRIWARPNDIARDYGIPRPTQYRLLAENPGIRTTNLRGVGSSRLINIADLEAFLEAQTTGGESTKPAA